MCVYCGAALFFVAKTCAVATATDFKTYVFLNHCFYCLFVLMICFCLAVRNAFGPLSLVKLALFSDLECSQKMLEAPRSHLHSENLTGDIFVQSRVAWSRPRMALFTKAGKVSPKKKHK